MKRGKLFLEDSDWKQADVYFDKVLDIDPEYAPAYVGKLCVELEVCEEKLLANNEKAISEYKNFQKAIRFADAKYRAKLEGYSEAIKERERLESERIAKKERQEQELFAKAKPVFLERRERIAKYQNCIAASYSHTVGLKSDGTVVAVGDNEYGQCNTGSWRDIGPFTEEKRIEQERRKKEQERIERERRAEEARLEQQRRVEQSKRWQEQGLCQYCGGKLSGLFNKKCKACGREN